MWCLLRPMHRTTRSNVTAMRGGAATRRIFPIRRLFERVARGRSREGSAPVLRQPVELAATEPTFAETILGNSLMRRALSR